MHNIHNPTFAPHWKTKASKTRTTCGIECCEATAVKCTYLASKEEVEHTLNQMVTALTVEKAKHSHISARPITTSLLVCLCTYKSTNMSLSSITSPSILFPSQCTHILYSSQR